MSRSLNDENDVTSRASERAQATFSEMMRRGRSFSGRERNCCFLNTNAALSEGPTTPSIARFANVSATSGIDLPDDGRALVSVDWDHDGDLDVWISNRNAPRLRFFRNDVRTDNHHLSLRLQGNGRSINRDAIGARVEVVLARTNPNESPPRPLIKTLRAGDSFLSQSSKWLHFGLGDAENIESVRVRWPGGDTELFANLESDRRYRLVQGSGEAKAFPLQSRDLAIAPEPVTLPATDSTARIPLVTLLPMAKLSYRTFAGETRQMPIGMGKPILLNLWASWCQPCMAELKELHEREEEIRAAGIEVVALSVDGLGDDRASAPAAERLVEELDLPFKTGRATKQLVSYLQALHDRVITRPQPLPVPVSFLIDEEGRVAVIYKGRLKIDDLLADLKHSRGTRLERFARSAPVAGRTLSKLSLSRRRNDFESRYRFATHLQAIGLLADAAAENRALIESFPKNAGPHNNLGISYIHQNKVGLAEASFREAIRIHPEFGRAHANLGRLLFQHGKLEEAAFHYEQAIKSDPRDDEHYEMLGDVLLGLQRWPEAQARLEKAIEITPNSANSHAHLGRALAAQKKFAQAVVHLERAIAIEPNHVAAKQNLEIVKGWISEGK